MWIERAKIEKLLADLSRGRFREELMTISDAIIGLESLLLASPEPQAVEVIVKDCNIHNTFCLAHDMMHTPITQGFLSMFGMKFEEGWCITAQKIAEPERTWRVIRRKYHQVLCEGCGSHRIIYREGLCEQCGGCGALISGEITWEEWREEKR